jgi:hypothetical protein
VSSHFSIMLPCTGLHNWPAHVKDCEGSTPSWLLDIMWSFFGKQKQFQFWEDYHAGNGLGIRIKSLYTLGWFSLPVDSTSASHTDSSPAYVENDEGTILSRLLDSMRNLLRNKDKFRFRKKHRPKLVDDRPETFHGHIAQFPRSMSI